jgi:hypothetical protein
MQESFLANNLVEFIFFVFTPGFEYFICWRGTHAKDRFSACYMSESVFGGGGVRRRCVIICVGQAFGLERTWRSHRATVGSPH